MNTYIFVELASEAEIMNAVLDEGYTMLDWSFMVFDVIEVREGTELHCEFDNHQDAQAFVFLLEKAGFDVEVK
tara:strand:- start:2213 stop:2431 length:219 start_codon:yes stop_codon:yes gene_type:complete